MDYVAELHQNRSRNKDRYESCIKCYGFVLLTTEVLRGGSLSVLVCRLNKYL